MAPRALHNGRSITRPGSAPPTRLSAHHKDRHGRGPSPSLPVALDGSEGEGLIGRSTRSAGGVSCSADTCSRRRLAPMKAGALLPIARWGLGAGRGQGGSPLPLLTLFGARRRLAVPAGGHQAGGQHPGRLPADLEGVARRIAADAEVAVLHLEHLTKEALRATFACSGRTTTRRRYSRSCQGLACRSIRRGDATPST